MTESQMERLTDVFRTIFNMPDLTLYREMSATDVAGWDSFNHINLVITIEEEFELRFTTEEVTSLQNVGDLFDLLDRKLKTASPS